MARPKTKKSIHLRIRMDLLVEIDAAAQVAGMNRTEWLENAAVKQIEQEKSRLGPKGSDPEQSEHDSR